MLIINKIWPVFLFYWSSEYIDRYILYATRHNDKKTPGSVRSMINLLPKSSIINIAINDPSALVKANGIFKIIPSYSLSSIPSIVVPESIIISGP